MLLDHELVACEENLPFWNKLNSNEHKTLLEGTVSHTYSANSVVHDDRNKCTGLLMVISGQLRVYIIGETGKEITLYRLFDRDVCVLSASCLIRNITFNVHVTAEKESTILQIATDAYQEVEKTNPSVLPFTSELISSRFSDVMWVVEQVVFMSLDRRLATHLLESAAIDQSDSITTTHEAVAKDLGTAREVITRMLNRFQEEGLIELSRGEITLINRQKLYELT